MLSNYNANINVSAQSTIDEQIAAYFNALIKEDKTFNISKNVSNSELYFENQEACEADYTEFEEKVRELASK